MKKPKKRPVSFNLSDDVIDKVRESVKDTGKSISKEVEERIKESYTFTKQESNFNKDIEGLVKLFREKDVAKSRFHHSYPLCKPYFKKWHDAWDRVCAKHNMSRPQVFKYVWKGV